MNAIETELAAHLIDSHFVNVDTTFRKPPDAHVGIHPNGAAVRADFYSVANDGFHDTR
jgi:hypothetical protein